MALTQVSRVLAHSKSNQLELNPVGFLHMGKPTLRSVFASNNVRKTIEVRGRITSVRFTCCVLSFPTYFSSTSKEFPWHAESLRQSELQQTAPLFARG